MAASKCKYGKVSRGPSKGRCRKSKKTASKPRAAKAAKTKPWGPQRKRCHYVSQAGSKAAAGRMVRGLKKDGYLAYSVKGSTVAEGHSIFSCGKK